MTPANQHEVSTVRLERARKAARRTAWLVAGIAAAVYAGFLLLGVLGK